MTIRPHVTWPSSSIWHNLSPSPSSKQFLLSTLSVLLIHRYFSVSSLHLPTSNCLMALNPLEYPSSSLSSELRTCTATAYLMSPLGCPRADLPYPRSDSWASPGPLRCSQWQLCSSRCSGQDSSCQLWLLIFSYIPHLTQRGCILKYLQHLTTHSPDPPTPATTTLSSTLWQAPIRPSSFLLCLLAVSCQHSIQTTLYGIRGTLSPFSQTMPWLTTISSIIQRPFRSCARPLPPPRRHFAFTPAPCTPEALVKVSAAMLLHLECSSRMVQLHLLRGLPWLRCLHLKTYPTQKHTPLPVISFFLKCLLPTAIIF